MKFCPTCKSTYADDANFCPQETCATPSGPQRLHTVASEAKSRFQLGPRLGGSSTGDVFRATDSVTGAQVAYKVVASDVLPNPAALGRAEREFKQLMRVQSGRIAAIIDCGRTPDERLYVAMELCEGEPLDKTMRGAAVPLERAKVIIAQVGQALLEAQKAGIVHRDVAPKNVILTPSGDVKVINFPLAKPINEKASGVAAYLSPEQVQGKPVDQRSNTYNLAALLYHLLTGEPPFQGTPETVLELHVGSPPLAPSQRRPEANLLPEVDRVILKALDKSSSRRHLTLRLFLSEVESLVAAQPTPAAAASGKEGPGGFARTMLFAGGQAEVANLVAKAIAARGASPAGGVPVTSPGHAPAAPANATIAGVAPPAATAPSAAAASAAGPRRNPSPIATPTAAPVSSPVGVAATIVAPPPAANPMPRISSPGMGVAVSPAPSPNSGEISRQREPAAPVAVAPSVSPAAGTGAVPAAASVPPAGAPNPISLTNPKVPTPAAGSPAQAPAKPAGGKEGKGSAFRETLWFKKGDVEHMIAEARAKIASPEPGKAGEAPLPGEEVLPIEDRYVDDGTVTADDRKKFSLRSGHTQASVPAVKAKVPGESMSEAEVIREVSSSRRVVIALVLVVLVLAAGAAALTLMRSKPTPQPGSPPQATAIPAPPAPATPPPAVTPPSKSARATASENRQPSPPDSKKGAKLVAAPPSKRDGSDKRATRRKSGSPRKRR